MAKKNNNYFELMENQVAYCVQASELLENMLCDFSSKATPAIHEEMHAIEHKADDVHHDILAKLSVEFITPIDQEDIYNIVQIIDDVTDALDEVVLEFYMYNLKVLPKHADEIAKKVNQCVKALSKAIAELKNFKRPKRLHELLVEVNTIEGEADRMFTEAMHNLFVEENDAKTLISNKAIYERLEKCCDLCEHATKCIEHVLIKNS